MRGVDVTAWGIVLAAGQSRRMGRAKALLMSGGRTLLAHAADRLREGGCADVIIVVNEAAPQVHAEAGVLGRIVPVADAADAEPIDSLRAAMCAMPPDVTVAIVLPVDCPLVRPATIAALLERVCRGDVAAVVPVHGGVEGHPVALQRRLFGAVGARDLEHGLRTLLVRHAPQVARLDVDDDAVLVDLDTPDDARRYGVRV